MFFWRNAPSLTQASCLVRVGQEPDGRFTAGLLGAPDLQATAATPEEAVELLRARLQEEVNMGSLVPMELPERNPAMRFAGHAKDDPEFDEYLEEIRKYRREVDRREGRILDSDECSDTSLTPTT